MSVDYLRRQTLIVPRNSTIPSVVIREPGRNERDPSRIVSGRLSRLTQLNIPHGDEYYPQDHVPPIGPEASTGYYLTAVAEDQDGGPKRTLSIITGFYPPTDEQQQDQIKLNKKTLNILYIFEPILSGFILFPLIALFWQCGWNILTILINYFNQKRDERLPLGEITIDEEESYKWWLLLFPTIVCQIILLLFYLLQNSFYNFLKKRNFFVQTILLKCHILILASVYLIQWKMFWTIYDLYFPSSLDSQIVVSITSLFGLIVFNEHLADLVCSPFLFSYDSIECSIHFGCPLLTKEMKEWKINLINYILYEIINSNLSILTWRGFYYLIDNYLLANDLDLSIGITFLIGYFIYYVLMYFQRSFEELNVKYEFWTFISINFPQFYRNIRHFGSFIGCVFLWRGYWVLYDTYVSIFDNLFLTYSFLYLLSFLVLSITGTSSSINGPLSNINDPNDFFPLYPHCYISIVHRKFYKLFYLKEKPSEENHEL